MGGGWGSNCPTPYSWLKPDENAICPGKSWGCGGAKLAKGTDLKEQGTSQLSEKLTN